MEKVDVKLTKSQCKNVAEFIDLHLLEVIRNDVDIDNTEWVKDLIFAMCALMEAIE